MTHTITYIELHNSVFIENFVIRILIIVYNEKKLIFLDEIRNVETDKAILTAKIQALEGLYIVYFVCLLIYTLL